MVSSGRSTARSIAWRTPATPGSRRLASSLAASPTTSTLPSSPPIACTPLSSPTSPRHLPSTLVKNSMNSTVKIPWAMPASPFTTSPQATPGPPGSPGAHPPTPAPPRHGEGRGRAFVDASGAGSAPPARDVPASERTRAISAAPRRKEAASATTRPGRPATSTTMPPRGLPTRRARLLLRPMRALPTRSTLATRDGTRVLRAGR